MPIKSPERFSESLRCHYIQSYRDAYTYLDPLSTLHSTSAPRQVNNRVNKPQHRPLRSKAETFHSSTSLKPSSSSTFQSHTHLQLHFYLIPPQSIHPSILLPSTKEQCQEALYTLSSPSFTKKQETPSCLPFAHVERHSRIPIPFSIFPSSYRSDDVVTTTQTHVEGEFNLPQEQRVGREGQSSFQANLPPRNEQFQEEVHITREEEHQHRPSRREDIYIREEIRPSKHTSTHIDVELPHRRQHPQATSVYIEGPQRRRYEGTQIDVAEREYRSRFQPSYREETRFEATVDPPAFVPSYREEVRVSGTTVDPPRFQGTQGIAQRSHVHISEETVDPPRSQAQRSHVHVSEETVNPPRFTRKSDKMGYYDEDGHYHSIRHGLHKAADRVMGRHHHHHSHHSHHSNTQSPQNFVEREEIDITIGGSRAGSAPRAYSSPEPAFTPNTVTIPCHHIRLGDLLILQGRPCQVIRITTSSATGQHRYLGVDLFTKQLHEESSFISNPSPSVVVQTMLGPVFKQYRVLDLQDGNVVAMTETGDVKQSLPVIDQSSLWSRLTEAFETGRGSVRVLVISDHGRELAVDMKTIHGSRL
ncbi:hypothetical protein VTL71DRAFT_7873 [Oculimacula yallundae]|uniref:Translation initiation factor 5A-like N-terminal domain-containing protein n=1 Tax=Oculimacula yallundae TaxID=86028 RepID=A0ABR4CW49_9HELO